MLIISCAILSKVFEFLDRGHSFRKAAGVFGIAPDTVNRWKQKLLKAGSLEDAPRRCAFRKLDPEKPRAHVAAHPDAYLAEAGEAFGCNESAVRKAFAKLKVTRKKNKRFREQKPEQAGRHLAGLAECAGRPIVYVDETGMDTWLCREHGWSERGVSVVGEACGRKHERVGAAGLLGESVIEPYQYGGTMESGFFEAWFEGGLLPALPTGSVIVMDNASFHRKGKLPGLAEGAGRSVLFPPLYSPELNPIENFWSWLKRQLRKILPGCPTFDYALCSVFEGR